MKMASRLIDLIYSKKTNRTCGTLFLLISKKQIYTYSTLFCIPLPLFCPLLFSLPTLLELLTPALSSSASPAPPVRFIPVLHAPIFPCSPLPLHSKNKYLEYFMCDLALEDNFLIKPSRANDVH